MKRNSLFLTAIFGATLLLSACGNKGDLVLPPTKPAKPQTTTPPPPDTTSKPATSP